MRRWTLLCVLLLAGCQNVVGPFEYRKPQRVDDPLLTIPEQEARARNRLPLPDDSPTVGPPSGTESPLGNRPAYPGGGQ